MEMEAEQSIEEKILEENRRLKTAIEDLSILNDIATAITSTQSLEIIIGQIVHRCVKHLRVEQGVVMLLDEKNTEKPFQTMLRKQDSSTNFLPYRFDEQLTGWMLKNRSPLIINDFQRDKRFDIKNNANLHIVTLLSVPLQFKGKMIGQITVFNKKSEAGFSSDDQRLLSIIAAQSAHVIENARLLLKEQTLAKMEEELRMAKKIQLNILPKNIPHIPRYDVYAVNAPAKEVGGDYYDFIKISEDRIAFCLGDISGKGIPAAMLMGNLQATLRGQTLIQDNVNKCISNANKLLFHSTDKHMFATLFYGELDLLNNKLTYCNAGHCPPISYFENEVYTLSEGGILIGCFESAEFNQASKILNVNELIVIYSDGVTESMNDMGHQFGEERLINLIKKNHNLSASEMIEKILSDVKNHSSKVEQTDDITLMTIKRNE